MNKLALTLGLCALIAAPAFADDHAAPAATTTEAPAAHTEAAPMKKKGKKLAKMGAKHGKKAAHTEETAPMDAPKAE